MMVKSFKFLFQFAWVNLAVILGFAAIVIAGAYATGVPNGANNLFRTYFCSFPLMVLLILFICCFSLYTSNLNLGLSFGAKRRDFFWATQGILLLYTAASWALQAAISAIPRVFSWPDMYLVFLSRDDQPFWVYPLICLTVFTLGCLCGLLFTRSKALGTIVLVVALLAFIAIMILLMIAPIFDPGGLWDHITAILTGVMAAVILICEFFIWRVVNRFVVR